MEAAPYKVIALDLDGTVLDSRRRVSPDLKQAIALLADRGVRTVLCTGRRWRTTLPVARELDAAHPVVVCAGGAQVKDVHTGRTLHTTPLDAQCALRAASAMRRGGLVPFLLYDRPTGAPELRASMLDRGRLVDLKHYRRNVRAFAYYHGEEPWHLEDPLAVYTVDHETAVLPALPVVRGAVGEQARVTAMVLAAYGRDYVALEVHDPAATKWNALRRLLDEWGVSPDDVLAMGDDVNDIPMLVNAGLSFAMGNAVPQVKAVADRVTASHDEDGVLQALRSVFPGLPRPRQAP